MEKQKKGKRTDKEIAQMIGGGRKIFKIILGLAAAVEAVGGTARDLERLEPDKAGAAQLLGQLAQLIVGKLSAPVVQVAWNTMLVWIIAACQFVNGVHSDITAEHFPLRPGDLTLKEVIAVTIPHSMSTPEVLKLLDGQGLRPATLVELLWWWLTHPAEQANCLVVALGSVWAGQSPCVDGDGGYRRLHLPSLAVDWGSLYAFAAVRKSAAPAAA